MTRSMSAKISSSDTALSGGAASNCARTAPGLAFGAIGTLRDVFSIICNPIGYLVKMLAKDIRRDVTEFAHGWR